ncbi:MAG: FG-GAP-like repeat-containing protein [Terriglobales bacterium]
MNRSQENKLRITAVGLTLLFALSFFVATAGSAKAQPYYVGFTGPVTTYGDLGAGYDNANYYPLNAMASGDFNGDGKPDLITGSYESGQLSYLEGEGKGTFGTAVQIDQLYAVMSIAAGDFNNDHLLDIAVLYETSGGGSAVNIYIGEGNGTFTLESTTPVLSNYIPREGYSLATGDFNHDGNLDLVAVTIYNNTAYILQGGGNGSIQSVTGYSTIDPNNPGDYDPYGVAVGDFNGDGKPDLAVSEGNGIGVLLNNGNGTFKTAVYYDAKASFGWSRNQGIATALLTSSAKKLDVVLAMSGGFVAFMNNGKGVFTPKPEVATPGTEPMVLAIADINSDSKEDVLIGDINGSVRTYFGRGNGTFMPGPAFPVGVGSSQATYILTADLNGDGFPDWVVENDQGGEVIVALGNGDGTFRTNAEYGWNSNSEGRNIVTADFNGDGYPDVAYSYVYGTNAGKFAVMLGSSHGQLASQMYATAGSCAGNIVESVAAGDVSGDGKQDVVAAIINSSNAGCQNNAVAVVLGSGNGKFKKPVYYSTGVTAQAYEIRLADLNHDGLLDIVTSNGDGSLSVLLNKGKGKFGTAIVSTSLTSEYANYGDLAIADFNGDGFPDIAVSTWGTQQVFYVLLGNGNGTFGAAAAITNTYGYAPVGIVAGDFNNDGRMDLAIDTSDSAVCGAPNLGNAAFAVYLGDGHGDFSGGALTCTQSEYPTRPVTADFNRDGKLDLFIPMEQNSYGDETAGPAVYQGNGDGTFTRAGNFEGEPSQLYYTGAVDVDAVVADFNNDGQPDIAVLDNDNINQGNDSYSSFVVEMQNLALPVSVSPVNLQFGSVSKGTSTVETVILTNDQLSQPLESISISVGGADPGDFPATSNCNSTEGAGADCTITVTFKPSQTGARSATISVQDNLGTQTVQLGGTGK